MTRCQRRDLDTLVTSAAHDGKWATTCQRFTFLLFSDAHVIIDVTGGADSTVTLYESDSSHRLGDRMGESDENNERLGSSPDTRLGRSLSAGYYQVEARLDSRRDLNSRIKVDIVREDLVYHPYGYYQRDFAVGYSFETADSEVARAVKLARDAWNAAVSGSWPRIKFCKLSDAGCTDTNYDRFPTVVKTGDYGSCTNNKVACAGYDVGTAETDGWWGLVKSKYRIRDIDLIVMDPPYGPDLHGTLSRLKWTFTASEHKQHDRLDGKVWWYLPGTMMHEFGHTIGLDDIGSKGFPNYLMGYGWKVYSIPATDIRYTHQVYRNIGGEPQ